MTLNHEHQVSQRLNLFRWMEQMTSVSDNDFSSAATFKCKAMAVGVFVRRQTHTASYSLNLTFFHEEMVCVFPKGEKKFSKYHRKSSKNKWRHSGTDNLRFASCCTRVCDAVCSLMGHMTVAISLFAVALAVASTRVTDK